MKKTLIQVFNDTLKNSNGKYSRKSLTMFVSFIMANILGVFIVTFNLFTNRDLHPYAIQVFYGFLASAVGTGILTVWDKFKNGIDIK